MIRLVLLLTAALYAAPVAADQKDAANPQDIERAEKEIELIRTATRIAKRARIRARTAVLQTKSAQKRIKECDRAFRAENRRSLEDMHPYSKWAGRPYTEYLWFKCFEKAWPYNAAEKQLYQVFIQDEIQRYLATVSEEQRKRMSKVLRKLTI
ncbi:MAG: hypothetical protein OYG32_17635 [Rhodospirillaceae bacterium]|nr:hypothetical protein [Rhodospirillaceae bacterium]MDE0256619.1 hypothetical protein [Rhodospirillaceae bacterium]MDE0619379.1 hypothetical protein [Rhodospirillaceae bacterium]